MKKTIRVIELFDRMVNGEEVPKKIKYDEIEFEYSESYNDYVSYTEISSIKIFLIDKIFKKNIKPNVLLNDEIEILDEEEFTDIEEFEEHKLINTRDILELEMFINKINADYNYKINQLIKNQKKIIERINKEN